MKKKEKKEMINMGRQTRVKSHKRSAHTRKISPTKTTRVKKTRVKSHKRKKPK
ncbi:MAG: hypothetical protein ACFE8A_14030 [Candidatus Hodarchaeota archaeon]